MMPIFRTNIYTGTRDPTENKLSNMNNKNKDRKTQTEHTNEPIDSFYQGSQPNLTKMLLNFIGG